MIRLFVAFILLQFSSYVLADEVNSSSPLSIHLEHSQLKAGHATWVSLRYTTDGYGYIKAKPIVKWTVPSGVTVDQITYQAPAGINGDFGYDDGLTIMARLSVAENYTQNSMNLSIDSEWQTCINTCLNTCSSQHQTSEAQLSINDSSIVDAAKTELFTEARLNMPDLSPWNSVIEGNALRIYMDEIESKSINSVSYYAIESGVKSTDTNNVYSFNNNALSININLISTKDIPNSITGILSIDSALGQKSYLLNSQVKTVRKLPAKFTSIPSAVPSISLWQAMVFSLLGGLILNLMPCVFPILSLKAFAFISAGSRSKHERHMEGWSYTAGILVSFAVIVTVLLALRSSGAMIGWGFQLQEPKFVALMVIILTMVALSLAGIFHMTLGRAEGAGAALAQKDGPKGAFFTGVLATLVATPCTAPLMAPAIGFALTQSAPVIIMVFMMLGLGLALPFLALSYSGKLAAKMPRPGPWMEKVKQGLAFPMLMTALWLLYVYVQQTNVASLFILLIAIISLSFIIWLRDQFTGTIVRNILLIAIVTVAILGINQDNTPPTTDIEITEYSAEKIDKMRKDGKPVFVYFTADWCITCKVNERIALFKPETIAAFKNGNITLMKGDWTNRNDEIAKVLARYERAGVPLYLYFKKGASSPVILPEIITVNTIIKVISD